MPQKSYTVHINQFFPPEKKKTPKILNQPYTSTAEAEKNQKIKPQ